MTPDELRIRLDKIEHQLKFFAEAYKTLHNEFVRGVHVQFDKELLAPAVQLLRNEVKEFRAFSNEFNQLMKNDSILGTLSFMAKKINEMDQTIKSISEKGIKKNLHLAFTVDGYEMVKKKPKPIQEIVEDLPDDSVKKFLDSIKDKRYQSVLIHRYGLFGEPVKTLDKTGELLGVSRERVRQMQAKALRMGRHQTRKDLVESLTHYDLKQDILGYKQ